MELLVSVCMRRSHSSSCGGTAVVRDSCLRRCRRVAWCRFLWFTIVVSRLQSVHTRLNDQEIKVQQHQPQSFITGYGGDWYPSMATTRTTKTARLVTSSFSHVRNGWLWLRTRRSNVDASFVPPPRWLSGGTLGSRRIRSDMTRTTDKTRAVSPDTATTFPWTRPILVQGYNNGLVRLSQMPRVFSTCTVLQIQRAFAGTGDDDDDDYLSSPCPIDDDDTIFALSSGALGGGQATAVAVIRISGPYALPALQQLTTTNNNGTRSFRPRVATLVQLQYQGRLLDQALVLYFPKPHSFTGQDVVELHCHGSRAVVQDVLTTLEQLQVELVPAPTTDAESPTTKRLRYAEAGEFTSRAFAAGKLDVLQVEALADLLAADTVLQKQQALSQLQGDLSRLYQDWKQQLIGALAHAEAIIDFGDDEHLLALDADDEEAQKQVAQQSIWGGVTEQIEALRTSMQRQLKYAQRGEWVRQGFSIAIVGPPNAGKSSLFNVLAQDEQAAIVSPIQGTTRDVLSVSLNLGGVKCRLQDTAGLRDETKDIIEQEGMKRAQQAAAQADLVVVLMDVATLGGSVGTQQQQQQEQSAKEADPRILQQELDRLVPSSEIPRENVILVLNKADLLLDNTRDDDDKQTPIVPFEDEHNTVAALYTISCETQQGMESFLQGLTNHILHRITGVPDGKPSTSSSSDGNGKRSDTNAVNDKEESILQEDPLMTRGRHRQHVQAALEALDRFLLLQQDGLVTVDLAAEELRLAASELGRLTGAIDVEDVLDQLFTDFCIGK